MRWLLIALFVSLGTLLVVAAGVARHIWLQHRGSGGKLIGLTRSAPSLSRDSGEEADIEPEL